MNFWWGFLSGIVATVVVAGLVILFLLYRAFDDNEWEDNK